MKVLTWITPLRKQCFVVLGVSLAMSQLGLVMGFSSGLLPQLKQPDSAIPIDEETGSWLASLPAIFIMVGNVLMAFIMDKFGRKASYYTQLVITIFGWIGVMLSTNLAFLMSARCLQGVGIGAITFVSPILIGEYSSPAHRGVFLMTIAVFMALGVLSVHTMISYLTWKMAALICIALAITNLIFAFFSPESPIWLADKGRYEECKTVFRWLRGDDEEAELDKMIEANVATQKERDEKNAQVESFLTRLKSNLIELGQTLKKNEFYKPVLIMIHFYVMAQWCGINLQTAFAVDFITSIVGEDTNVPVVLISMDLLRLASTAIALAIIKNVKRRRLIIASVGLNVLIMFTIAAFTYCKEKGLLPFDSCYNWYIGIALINLLIFSITVGAVPMSFILAGEIFPLRYKSLGGGFSCLFFSLGSFLNVKTIPFFFNTLNVYGSYLLYGGLLIYFMVVVLALLPETKDRTLQDVEEEFKGLKHRSIKPVRVNEDFHSNSHK